MRRSLGSSPPARRRRARALTGGTEERSRSEDMPVSDRGRGRRPRTAGGNGDGLGHGLQALEEAAGGFEAGDPEDLFATAEHDHRRHAHHGVFGD